MDSLLDAVDSESISLEMEWVELNLTGFVSPDDGSGF
jgi:hypothetical protein